MVLGTIGAIATTQSPGERSWVPVAAALAVLFWGLRATPSRVHVVTTRVEALHGGAGGPPRPHSPHRRRRDVTALMDVVHHKPPAM
jgi:hypothetical protein